MQKNPEKIRKNIVFVDTFFRKFVKMNDLPSLLMAGYQNVLQNETARTPFLGFCPCFIVPNIRPYFLRTFSLAATKRAHVRFEGRAGCQPLRGGAPHVPGNQHVLQNEHALMAGNEHVLQNEHALA